MRLKKIISACLTGTLAISILCCPNTYSAKEDYSSKISTELVEKITDSKENEIVPVCISLKECVDESEIKAYVQQFANENAELLDNITFQSRLAEFIIAEVRKENIEKLAELYIVNNIDYWVNSIERIEGEETNCLYENNFIEWSVMTNGEHCLKDGYYYNEIYYNKDNNGETNWVLVDARYLLEEPDVEVYFSIGDRTIMSGSLCAPFKCRYGIYDVNENNFYDLYDIADNSKKFEGLTEVINSLKIGNLTGDTNLDEKINIADVTYIQKSIANITDITKSQEKIADIDKDGKLTISDVTLIQKYLVNLYNWSE